MYMTARDHKKVIQEALNRRYGFAPILKHIVIVGCSENTYHFRINGHDYMLNVTEHGNIIRTL